MIGQQQLSNRIQQLIENDAFPRFSIFVGPKGSGKKTLLLEMFEGIYLEDNKVDSVRKMIEMVYRVGNRTFIMPDADTMSVAAKNALLKVVEECPNDNYFIMTLEDENNTLETIRSRGTVFHMDRYTPDEIVEYAESKYTSMQLNWTDIIKELCETPGDVDLMVKMGTKDFYDYVQLAVDNIAEVSLANAFKMPNKIALKEDAEGYDLRLFWKAFMKVLVDTNRIHDFGAITITSKYLQKLRIKGINRSMLMDNWILEIRELWQS